MELVASHFPHICIPVVSQSPTENLDECQICITTDKHSYTSNFQGRDDAAQVTPPKTNIDPKNDAFQ